MNKEKLIVRMIQMREKINSYDEKIDTFVVAKDKAEKALIVYSDTEYYGEYNRRHNRITKKLEKLQNNRIKLSTKLKIQMDKNNLSDNDLDYYCK